MWLPPKAKMRISSIGLINFSKTFTRRGPHTMDDHRIGDWAQMADGSVFYPLDPRPEEITITNLAHHLSMTGRYNGASTRYYSVAEHSLLVSLRCPPGYELDGLLHDAPEGLGLGDIIAPVKRYPLVRAVIKPIEDRLHKAVSERFGVRHPIPDIVEVIDKRILADEQAQCMVECEREWWHGSGNPLGVKIRFIDPPLAEMMFLRRFKELKFRK